MRPDEADAKPKRLVLLGALAQGRHGHLGQRAVVEGVVRHVGTLERRTARPATGGSAFLGGFRRLVGSPFRQRVVLRQSVRPVAGLGRSPRHRPRGRVVEAAVIQLAHTLDEIAVLLEQLRQRHHVGQRFAEMGLQVPDLRRVGPRAGQQAGPRRRANRLLTVRPVERDAAASQPVQVRRVDVAHAVRAELRAQVIHGDKQHVRALGGGELAAGEDHPYRQKHSYLSSHRISPNVIPVCGA